MLIPLTRKKFEDLLPIYATGAQYNYYWGTLPDLLKRLLISVVAVVVVILGGGLLGEGFQLFRFVLGMTAGLYWLWAPVFWASLRNMECRRYQYGAFWQGEVLDTHISEELIGKEETVNKRGELVIVENRERRLNLIVGDEVGFTTRLQVPLKRNQQAIVPGDRAEMLVMSHRADMGKIAQSSDIYLPELRLWVSDYPYLRRDLFEEVSRQLNARDQEGGSSKRSTPRSRRRSSSRRRPTNADY